MLLGKARQSLQADTSPTTLVTYFLRPFHHSQGGTAPSSLHSPTLLARAASSALQ